MNVKEKLLSLLYSDKGVYFSGEKIADELEVSRTAVWKAVQALRKDGYKIDAIQNKGYCLAGNIDKLSSAGIRKYLKEFVSGIDINVFSSLPSTNTFIRAEAEKGASEGYICIAEHQTKGRGRLGRSFYSPSDTGLYMSILLRPSDILPREVIKLTTMAGVAVCEAIEEVSGKKASIKWVNDVFMEGRKVCGILSEAAFGLENGKVDYAVVGAGINVYAPQNGFPDDIENTAGAVFKEFYEDAKCRLAAGFINNFMKYYMFPTEYNYSGEYKKRCFVIGSEVEVIGVNSKEKAFALDVDDDCALIVKFEDGSIKHLSTGEISIKPVKTK